VPGATDARSARHRRRRHGPGRSLRRPGEVRKRVLAEARPRPGGVGEAGGCRSPGTASLMPKMQQGIKGGFTTPPQKTIFEVYTLQR
jgi:hypothetical protein